MSGALNKGFTLVEVITAMGAFVIAFLTGFAAIAMLMQQMQISYRTTVAASAATLALPKFDAGRTSNPFLEAIRARPGLRFYGGPMDINTLTETDVNLDNAKAFIFREGKVMDMNLRAYNRDIVVVVDATKKYATLWAAPIYSGGNNNEGGQNLFRNGSTLDARCDFLGKYDIPVGP